jgi:hypothetical protein
MQRKRWLHSQAGQDCMHAGTNMPRRVRTEALLLYQAAASLLAYCWRHTNDLRTHHEAALLIKGGHGTGVFVENSVL